MNSERVWPIAQAVAVLAVLIFLLFSLEPVLNPLLLFLVLVALAAPVRRSGEASRLVVVSGVLTLFWVLGSTGSLLAPFLVALGVAYLLDPAVDRLQERGMGRTWGIAALAGPFLVLLALLVTLGGPALGRQGAEIISALPEATERVAAWARNLERELGRIPWLGQVIHDSLTRVDAQGIVALLEKRQAELARQAWSGVLGVGRGLSAALTILGYLVLTPVITFYLLRDWDRLVARVDDLIPRPSRPAVAGFFSDLDHLLGKFLRGQITVAVLMGTLTALGLWAWGFPYAFLVGALVAVFSVVPYLGLVLSLIPAVVVALTSGDVGLSLVKVVVIFGVVQGLEGTVISPRIVGDSVGLHPVWILLAIASGGYFFGFVGLLLAVPAAAALKLLARRGVDRYRSSEPYLGSGPPASG